MLTLKGLIIKSNLKKQIISNWIVYLMDSSLCDSQWDCFNEKSKYKMSYHWMWSHFIGTKVTWKWISREFEIQCPL